MLICSVGMVLCFVAIQVLVSVDMDDSQDTLYTSLLVINTVFSSINAVAQVVILVSQEKLPNVLKNS